MLPAITGKVEMVYEGEQQGAEVVAKKLIGTAVKKLFDAKFPAPDAGRPTERRRQQETDDDEEPTGPVRRARPAPAPEKIHPLYEATVAWFAAGNTITLSDDAAVCRAPRRARVGSRPEEGRRGALLPAPRRKSSRSAWSSCWKA